VFHAILVQASAMDEASCRWLRRRVAHRANPGADRPSICGSSGA